MYFIIFAVILVTIIMWIASFRKSTEEFGVRSICERSSCNAARLAKSPEAYRQLLNCPTLEYSIDGNDALQKYSITQAMIECRDMLKCTKLEETFCHPCTIIEFETDKPLEGLPEFIQQRHVPGTREKYSEVLCTESVDSIKKASQGGMERSEQWMIVYKYKNLNGIARHCPILVKNTQKALTEIDCN